MPFLWVHILSELHALLREFGLLILFTLVLIVHFLIYWRKNPAKLFYVLSFLWCIKYIIFVTSMGLNNLFKRTLLLLETLNLLTFLVITFFVSVSLILKKPFWYKNVENKICILFGIIGLIFSSWLTWVATYFFIDFEIWRYLLKP